MASCLGIYIDRNLIKYAKVKRRKDKIKVEAFGIDVFEDFEDGIEKVISETNSYKTPICVNILNEIYNYFEVYSALDKKDIVKSLEIEFEKVCNKKKLDSEAFESRFLLTENSENFEKFNSIYVSTDKKELEEQIEVLSEYKLISASPLAISLTNLLEVNEKDSFAIINIENDTKITIIIDGQIKEIDTLKNGLFEVSEKINETEMSWKKSYDIYKNITIYKNGANSLSDNENEYLDLVMPVLEKISDEAKKDLKKYKDKLNKVCITGMGASINNIDLYFQSKLEVNECIILKPFFIDANSSKYPVKEYIEVNSAIALALDGIEFINKDLNFAPISKLDNFEKIISYQDEFDIRNWREYLRGPYDIAEKTILRAIIAFLLAIVIFIIFSASISRKLSIQTNKINQKIETLDEKIELINKDIKKVDTYNSIYQAILKNEPLNSSRIIAKDSIPNLLNKIMFIIPGSVQLTEIKNTSDNHIVIKAISESKDDLESFYSSIETDGEIITNMKKTYNNENEKIIMTIEGDIL